MNEAEFKKHLADEGYEDAGRVEWEAGLFNDSHTHEFDASIFVVSGEITTMRGAGPETFMAGDACTLGAETPHTEQVGSEGVTFLVGRRD